MKLEIEVDEQMMKDVITANTFRELVKSAAHLRISEVIRERLKEWRSERGESLDEMILQAINEAGISEIVAKRVVDYFTYDD